MPYRRLMFRATDTEAVERLGMESTGEGHPFATHTVLDRNRFGLVETPVRDEGVATVNTSP